MGNSNSSMRAEAARGVEKPYVADEEAATQARESMAEIRASIARQAEEFDLPRPDPSATRPSMIDQKVVILAPAADGRPNASKAMTWAERRKMAQLKRTQEKNALRAKAKPHRCNPRFDDFAAGVTRLPPRPRGTFRTFVRCMLASEGNEPTRPYVYLDWEDVEKARGESDLPAEYFNIKHGWGNAKDEKKLELWKQRGGMTAQTENTRVEPGDNCIHQEPLERTLQYLGLSISKDQVMNTIIDGEDEEGVKQALTPGQLPNARHWFDEYINRWW